MSKSTKGEHYIRFVKHLKRIETSRDLCGGNKEREETEEEDYVLKVRFSFLDWILHSLNSYL